MGELTRIFVDTSKQVFQLHGVDAAERVAVRRTLRRSQMLDFFAELSPTMVGLEACGASHHWAREIAELGHEVKLVPPQYVKAYLKRGKNDARDAEAGCEAMSRPTMRFVPVKTQEQQAATMLMRVREQLVRRRTQLGNEVRGHAAEFGLVAGKGLDKIGLLLERIAADQALPALARRLFAQLAEAFGEVQARLERIEGELAAWRRQDECCARLMRIPSVGPVCASLLVMKTPDPKAFKSGRDFAAWIGLTPSDHSTAGRQRLGVITKAGDEALRSALVAGAMSVVQHTQRRGKGSPWLLALLQRKHPKEAAVALANKTARIAWKLMVTGQGYTPDRSASDPNPELAQAA